jgi:hypothetical protein
MHTKRPSQRRQRPPCSCSSSPSAAAARARPQPRSSAKLSTLKPFLSYAVTGGQKYAKALDFAPLPKNVVAKDETLIKNL